MNSGARVLVVEPSSERRQILVQRLRAQGYEVDEASDGAAAAEMALAAPPSAVVASLWMPSVSGLQLCRVLRSEPATSNVPVLLCAERDEPRNAFWAEHAGAAACVTGGRTGALVRALERAIAQRSESAEFFVQLGVTGDDIRDRIARHLDSALFDSILSAELRGLASASTFERLFDRLAQLLTRLTRYRWIALATTTPTRFAVHAHPHCADEAEVEARQALGLPANVRGLRVEDEDASAEEGSAPVVRDVLFGGAQVARMAIAPQAGSEAEAVQLADAVAREIGGAVRMTTLLAELERSATTDALTGLMNRRAFVERMGQELARSGRHGHPISVALIDVDHFKQVNDRWGHAAGDRVLARIGALLRQTLRASDLAARWGGEELVVAFTSTDGGGGVAAAERLRAAVAALEIPDGLGGHVSPTVSVGVALLRPEDTLDVLIERADGAMYASKHAGRNRVTLAEDRAPISAPDAPQCVA